MEGRSRKCDRAVRSRQLDAAFLPTSIQAMRIHGAIGNQVWCYARQREIKGASVKQEVMSDLYLFDDDGQVIAEVLGLRGERVSAASLLRLRQRVHDWLYEITWQRHDHQTQAIPRLPADYLPAPSTIAESVQRQIATLHAQHHLSQYPALLSHLDALSTTYLLDAFTQLGWTWHINQRIAPALVAEQLRVDTKYHRLLSRMLEMLHEDGLLRRVDDGWEICRLLEIMPLLHIVVFSLKKEVSKYSLLIFLSLCLSLKHKGKIFVDTGVSSLAVLGLKPEPVYC